MGGYGCSTDQAGESCGQKESIQLILHSGFDLSGMLGGLAPVAACEIALAAIRTADCTLV
jgi:hypothetical protein